MHPSKAWVGHQGQHLRLVHNIRFCTELVKSVTPVCYYLFYLVGSDFGRDIVDPTVYVNELVDVAVIYRREGGEAVPQKVNYQGRAVNFVKLGMRHPTSKGKRMIHVFDVSDGMNDYRLEFDAERLTWLLVAVIYG